MTRSAPRLGAAAAARRMSERLQAELQADFEQHGPEVIALVRRDKPLDYLKLVQALAAKATDHEGGGFEQFTDDELADLLAALRQARGAGAVGAARDGQARLAGPPGNLSSLSEAG